MPVKRRAAHLHRWNKSPSSEQQPMIIGTFLLHAPLTSAFGSLCRKHCGESYGSMTGPNGNRTYFLRSSVVSKASCALIIASEWARCKTFRQASSPPSPFQPNLRAKRCGQSLIGDMAHGAVAVPDIRIAL